MNLLQYRQDSILSTNLDVLLLPPHDKSIDKTTKKRIQTHYFHPTERIFNNPGFYTETLDAQFASPSNDKSVDDATKKEFSHTICLLPSEK